MRAILTFHSIDDGGSVLSYRPQHFEQLVRRLRAHDLPLLSVEGLLRAESGVALTFDDGMRSVATEALPVLREYDAPATLFLTTGYVGSKNTWPSQPAGAPVFDMMTWDEVGACVESGVAVESHTVSHPDLAAASTAQIEDECAGADEEIERQLGVAPSLMAYPYGAYGPAALEVVARRYRAAVTTRLAYLPPGGLSATWRYEVPRLDTYYLQSASRMDLTAPGTKAYLAVRRSLRALRSWNQGRRR